jgi:5-oxoprolinase (ATP-hydrolysing)
VRALDGREVNLGNKNSVEVCAGDLLKIATPGGGGFGAETAK